MLDNAGRFEVVGEAGDGAEAVRGLAETQPAVVLLDVALPAMDSLETLPLLYAAAPGVRVVVLSAFERTRMAPASLAAGAVRQGRGGRRGRGH